jgi:hypothetical protein
MAEGRNPSHDWDGGWTDGVDEGEGYEEHLLGPVDPHDRPDHYTNDDRFATRVEMRWLKQRAEPSADTDDDPPVAAVEPVAHPDTDEPSTGPAPSRRRRSGRRKQATVVRRPLSEDEKYRQQAAEQGLTLLQLHAKRLNIQIDSLRAFVLSSTDIPERAAATGVPVDDLLDAELTVALRRLRRPIDRARNPARRPSGASEPNPKKTRKASPPKPTKAKRKKVAAGHDDPPKPSKELTKAQKHLARRRETAERLSRQALEIRAKAAGVPPDVLAARERRAELLKMQSLALPVDERLAGPRSGRARRRVVLGAEKARSRPTATPRVPTTRCVACGQVVTINGQCGCSD